jgi:CHAD domain-containing protein
MAQEIERRFLLDTEPQWLAGRRLVSVGAGLEAEIVPGAGPGHPVIARVSFPSEQASREFLPPGWLGREVAGAERDASQRLSSALKPRRGSDKVGGMGYRLKRSERVDDGIRRIAAARADHALHELAAAQSGADFAEAIHSARKDMKKLRAVLRLVREPLGKTRFRAESRRYRDAARLLARSRDAEVKLETLAALRERFGTELPGAAASAWRQLLEAERDEVAGAAGEAPARVEQAIATIAAGRERIAEWALSGDSWKLIGPGLRRGYRQGRRELKRTQREPSADNVHRWRKRVKDHWYQLRLLRKAWPQLLDETAGRAHELADLLGDHHDLTVLAEDLAGRPNLASREQLTALIERRQGELLEFALDLGARLFAEKPKAFSARLEAYWLA